MKMFRIKFVSLSRSIGATITALMTVNTSFRENQTRLFYMTGHPSNWLG